MSQIQQLAAAINVSVRQIDEQIAKLGNYQSKLEEMWILHWEMKILEDGRC